MAPEPEGAPTRRGLWIVGGVILAFIVLAIAASAYWSAVDDNAVREAHEATMPPAAPTPMGPPETLPTTTNPTGPTGGELAQLPEDAVPPPIGREGSDGR